jgi:Acetyltransferase (GNAT) domain
MVGTTVLQSITTQVISPSDPAWQECLKTIPHDFYHLPGYLELEANRINGVAEAAIVRAGEDVFFLPYIIRNCDALIGDMQAFNGDRVYDIVSPYGYPGMLVDAPGERLLRLRIAKGEASAKAEAPQKPTVQVRQRAGQSTQFIETALNTIYENWRQRNICSAFLRLHPLLNSDIDPSISDRYDSVDSNSPYERLNPRGEVVICDLSEDLADIWRQIRSNHRTKINKAKRTGVVARMVPIDEYLDIFIDIYTETMHRVNATGAYFFTKDYFHKLVEALGEGIWLCIVEADGEVIAASLITEFSGIVQYHLGGTRTQFLPQSPTTIAFDYVIRWAKERNNRYLNFGGGLGGDRDSLYHFKAGFSNHTRSFKTMEVIIDRDLYDRLTQLRSESAGMTTSALNDASFFPIYRLPSA